MERKLQDALDPAIIDMAVEGETKEEILRRLSEKLLEAGYISDLEEFLRDIYRREAEGPTGMGGCLSIPHGSSAAARRTGIAVGRTVRAVPWESCAGASGWQETRLVFLFCEPARGGAEAHLDLLSQLAEKLSGAAAPARLLECRGGEELLAALASGGGEA